VTKLSLLTRLGNAAAVLFGAHGDITRHTQRCGCSRQTAYDHAQQVHDAVADAQRPGPSRERLREENQRLREENRQLWDWLDQSFACPKAKRRQFAVQAAALGLSLHQTLALLAILLPAALLPGRATLGRWVRQDARRARRLLQVLDGACRTLVVCLCVDEIFFRRQPVLMGVEPFSLAWVLGERTPDRSGPTWAQALAAWPDVEDVAADGGRGIALGLELAVAKRREDAAKKGGQGKDIRVRLDVFHTRREGARAVRAEWAYTERLWEEAEKTERAKARFDRGGGNGCQFNQGVVRKAWAPAEAAFTDAERKDQAWQRAVAALGVFRPDGRVKERSWAEAELQAAALSGPRWAKVRRMLLDRRTLTFLDRLQQELAVAEPCPERREALAALWRGRQAARRARGEAATRAVLQVRLRESICARLGAGEESYGRVSRVLRRVVRASSAVEGVNSVVRMHQARHRQLTQELLDLKRLYWNCRRFRSGKRRDKCPYEHLGLRLPSYDPWELLQRDPDDLKQQLSSQGVAT
jgi:hypothetical protein